MIGEVLGIGAWEHLLELERRSLAALDDLSPPASEGTRSTGVTGIQVPTRWRADGSSP